MITYTQCPVCKSDKINISLSAKDNTVSNEIFEILKCDGCTHLFTQNVAAQNEIGKYYASENYVSHSDTQEGLVNKLYHNIRKITLIAKKSLIDTNQGSTFTGNGTATTNNKGEFVFVTTYPPAMQGLASHVDVRVEHYMLGTIQTTVMLNGKKVSDPSSKPEFDSVVEALGNTDISIYNFEIVLPGTGIKGYTDMSD